MIYPGVVIIVEWLYVDHFQHMYCVFSSSLTDAYLTDHEVMLQTSIIYNYYESN